MGGHKRGLTCVVVVWFKLNQHRVWNSKKNMQVINWNLDFYGSGSCSFPKKLKTSVSVPRKTKILVSVSVPKPILFGKVPALDENALKSEPYTLLKYLINNSK